MKPSTVEESNARFEHNHGFTLLELLVAITIAAMASAWAIPNMQRQFQQQQVDHFTQNLETGMFNLIAKVRKSSKYCTLFKSKGKTNEYLNPDTLLELTAATADPDLTPVDQCRLRRGYLDCPERNNSCDINPDDFFKFRFLSKEKTKDSKSIEVLTSQANYQLSPQGTNPKGEDIIFRIRSRKWDQYPNLITRCLVISGNGHLFKGTWEYDNPTNNPQGCQLKCPPNSNCNG